MDQTPPTNQLPTSPVAPAVPAQTQQNPGQLMGILSIVLSIMGLGVVGIVLGILSTKKSKAAGQSAVLGIVGLVMSILATLVGIIWIALITIAATSGVQARTEAQSARVNATAVVAKAEAYFVLKDQYPVSVNDFSATDVSKLTDTEYTVDSSTPTTNKTVKYVRCSDDGAQVSYYDALTKTVVIMPLGTAPSTAC
ncbi:MAG: DUF4190 domain-containing protein [Candidatus Saccharimonas sp.]